IPQSAFRNSFLFTSREYEPKANLYYYRARYYDPGVGRFLSTDPILRPPSCPTCPGANTFPIEGAGLLGYPTMNKKMLRNPQRLHSYVYCLNNPVKLVDPMGLWEIIGPSPKPCYEQCYWDCRREHRCAEPLKSAVKIYCFVACFLECLKSPFPSPPSDGFRGPEPGPAPPYPPIKEK
ncbi:MAG: RHS repeat-associated core domain-containing protein, partial [bacterium]